MPRRRSRRDPADLPRGEREAILAAAWRAAGLGYWQWRVAEDALHVSTEAAEILGLSSKSDGVPLNRLLAVVHPKDRGNVRKRIRDSARRDLPLDVECRIECPGVGERAVRLRAAVAPESAGTARHLDGTVQDITERRALDDALWETSAILHVISEHCQNIIWVRDAETLEPLYTNPAFEAMLGWPPSSLRVVRGIREGVVHPEDMERVRTALERARRGPEEVEFRALRSDGEEFWLRSRMFPVPGPPATPRRIVGLVEDVTAEHDPRRGRAPSEPGQRSNGLDDVGPAIAHELGQPLFAIANYARGCLRYIDGGDADPARLRVAAERIASQAERASMVLDRLRGLANGDGPRIAPEDVNELVAEAVGLARQDLPADGPVLRQVPGQELPPVAADRIQMVQTIGNLIRNAVEAVAGDEGGEVEIRTERSGAGVRVAVTDNGPGIAAHLTDRVLDAFTTTKPRGMGMGLAICRSVIEAHGGRLSVHSTPPSGTTAEFTLYAAKAEGAAHAG